MLTFSLYQGLGRFPIHLNNIFFMINLLLPGTSVIYYGDEIGMSNNATDLNWSEVQDPYTTNSLYCNQTQFEKDECICRDPSRTPMQVNLKPRHLDTVQDFLIKLGIKPHMHLWKINILSLNNVIVRPTKIMNRADKNWAHF